MPHIQTRDGTRIFYKDWGTGPVDMPTLILHGDDDQMAPIADFATLSARLIERATLKVYPGGSHALGDTSREHLNADLLAFARS